MINSMYVTSIMSNNVTYLRISEFPIGYDEYSSNTLIFF